MHPVRDSEPTGNIQCEAMRGRTLKINETDAETVRTIYRLYLALGSVDALKTKLTEPGHLHESSAWASGGDGRRTVLLKSSPLQHSAQPALCRRDCPQGAPVSGSAPGDHRPGDLGRCAGYYNLTAPGTSSRHMPRTRAFWLVFLWTA